MKSVLSAGDLLWAGFPSESQSQYRNMMRNLSEPHPHAHHVLAQAFDVPDWDDGDQVPDEYLGEVSSEGLGAWLVRLLNSQRDIEVLWAQRNVQGLGIALRAQAEHVGLGSLRFGSTYGVDGRNLLVRGPDGPDRLRWSRRRIGWLLSDVSADRYGGLTVLEGFAHPSRFSMEVYLDRSLNDTGPVEVGPGVTTPMSMYMGSVAQRLLAMAAPLAWMCQDHAA